MTHFQLVYLPSDGCTVALLINDDVNTDYAMPNGEIGDNIRNAFKDNEEGNKIMVSFF